MAMTKGFWGMLTLSATVTVVSIIGLIYIMVAQPEYLRSDRDGVPFYTPMVENPEGGEAIKLGDLIRHYKGE
ncbi:MAG: hypothetical protein C0631_16390 [Sedimenticola sp.]|jgi:leucyl aminopeptidase|nr:MAG: hypothetical protein C0631_16390 [Sedimenticola sp.]